MNSDRGSRFSAQLENGSGDTINFLSRTAPINRKTMLGVRCFGELKYKLTEEARSRGITLSEYCEGILLNKDSLQAEKDEAFAIIN